jgi:glycosyltransferase involved in cell wall biosynthesis
LKVLFVHERFPPDYRGGGEYFVLETARRMRERGVDVHVLTTGDPADTSHAGIPTRRLDIHPYRLNLQARTIAAAAADADLIQTFTYHACLPAYLAAKRIGKPVVCTIMALFGDQWREMRGPIVGRLFARWERMLVTRPYDRTVFVSDFSRDLGLGLGADPARAVVINPAISLENYGPAAQKEDYALFVGKLESRKGIHDVLAVARALPHLRMRIVGWGPEEPLVRNAALPNVEFTPFEKGAPLYDAFARARLFVFPSRAETFGLAIVEAMASGCAIVSTVPLPCEGIAVPAGDPGRRGAAVGTLWSQPQRMHEMGARNVALAQRYHWDTNVTAMLRLYAEILPSQARE